MKKQLLIAAVAASMTSVAMADISIAGSAKMNYLNTDSTTIANNANTFSTEINLGITGKSGDTSVVVNLQTANQADNDVFDIQDSYMSSSVAGVAVKAGNWRGGNNLLEDGDATGLGKFEATYAISGVTVTYTDQTGAANGESIKFAGEVAGVAVSHKMFNDGAAVDTTDTSVSGSFGGVNVAYRSIDSDTNTSDKDSLEISTEVQGMTLTYAQFDTDAATTASVTSNGALGDIDGVEAAGFSIATTIAGNAVKFRTVDTKVGAHTNGDNTINTVIVTRALASGATFEATYTDTDLTGAGEDTKKLDLELSVSF